MTASSLTVLGTRARGLATHLFGRADLEALSRLGDVAAIARTLTRSGRLSEPIAEPATPPEIDRAVRKAAARHVATLARWCQAVPLLDVFYADQERKALRALVRGALQGAPSTARLAGLVPTPTLPERALLELSRQPTCARVIAELLAVGHPDAPELRPLVAAAEPVLLELGDRYPPPLRGTPLTCRQERRREPRGLRARAHRRVQRRDRAGGRRWTRGCGRREDLPRGWASRRSRRLRARRPIDVPSCRAGGSPDHAVPCDPARRRRRSESDRYRGDGEDDRRRAARRAARSLSAARRSSGFSPGWRRRTSTSRASSGPRPSAHPPRWSSRSS